MKDEFRWDVSGGLISPDEENGFSILKPFLKTANRFLDGIVRKIKSGKYELVLRRKNKSRSMSANAYMWVLCDEIAKVMPPITKEDVYREAISKAGVSYEIKCTRQALARSQEMWKSFGVGFFSEIVGEQTTGDAVVLTAYVGSSRYTQTELSRLIEFLVEEAERQGINTMDSKERRTLIMKWRPLKKYEA